MGVTYVVKLSHEEKGVGYSAKKALDNLVRANHSGIAKVKLLNSSSRSSELHVEVKDMFPDEIEQCLMKSGRMPTKQGKWSLESINVKSRGGQNLQKKIEQLEKETSKYKRLNKDLKLEVEGLRKVKSEINFESGLDAILTYFKTKADKYKPVILVDNGEDLVYLNKLLYENVEPDFSNYMEHIAGRNVSADLLKTILEFNQAEADKHIQKLQNNLEKSKAKKQFTDHLKAGNAKIVTPTGEFELPEDQVENLLSSFDEYEYPNAARALGRAVSKYERWANIKKRVGAENLSGLQSRFNKTVEAAELIRPELKPVGLAATYNENHAELYFSILRENASDKFLGFLLNEISGYFEGTSILDHELVAFSVPGTKEESLLYVNYFSYEPLITLSISGFNQLIVYHV